MSRTKELKQIQDGTADSLRALEHFPAGSLESRASARDLLDDPDAAPIVPAMFVSKEMVLSGKYDFNRGRIGERHFVRQGGEGLEAFKQRVTDELPVDGGHEIVAFWFELE